MVSIGPGDVSLLNQATVDTLCGASPLILRTDHHPLVSWLNERDISYVSLDDLYESSDDFDRMHAEMAKRVWQLAADGRHAVYAVPDLLTDRSVDELYRYISKVGDDYQFKTDGGVYYQHVQVYPANSSYVLFKR